MATILREDDRADRLRVRLHRPEARNAIDQAMVDELHAVCDELERTPRILVIAGGGGVFASGADIAELRDRTPEDALAGINSRLFDRIARLPMPVIAVVDGWALGGGAELAYAADFRIATDRARFGSPEPSLGIVPAAGGDLAPAAPGRRAAREGDAPRRAGSSTVPRRSPRGSSSRCTTRMRWMRHPIASSPASPSSTRSPSG